MRVLGRHLGKFRGLGRSLTPIYPPVISDWILATSFWDDDGTYIDTEVWID